MKPRAGRWMKPTTVACCGLMTMLVMFGAYEAGVADGKRDARYALPRCTKLGNA